MYRPTKQKMGYHLCQLFANATNILIPNVIQLLFILTLDGITLAEDLCIWRHYAVWFWVCFHDLELY